MCKSRFKLLKNTKKIHIKMYLVSYLSILIIINPITNINGNKNIPINFNILLFILKNIADINNRRNIII